MKYEKYKKDLDYSYALGITLTFELLINKSQYLQDVYFHSSFNGEAKEKMEKILKSLGKEPIISDKLFNILASKENVYVIGIFKKFTLKLQNNNHLVLVNPANAGNLGTIMRTSLGFGIKDIAIIKPCVDVFDPKTIRASMGAVFNINFKLYDSFEDYKQQYNNHHLYPFMLKAKTKLHQATFSKPFSLIFGNEATGLPDNFLNYHSVIIAHSKEIDSLNITNAVSIAIYEATKNIY